MNKPFLNIFVLINLFLMPFLQVFAQTNSIKLQTSDPTRLANADQASPKQIIPFRLSLSETEREKRFWILVKDHQNTEDFKLFSEQFPNSIFLKYPSTPILDERPSHSTPTIFYSNSKIQSTKLENTKIARETLYKNLFLPNYKSQIYEQQQIAYKAANQYLYNFAADNDEIVKYLQNWVKKHGSCYCEAANSDIERFNKAMLESDFAETFMAGKDLLKKCPRCLTAILFMVDVGYIQTSDKNLNDLNDETIFFAQQAIKRIEAGEIPEKNDWKPFYNKSDALAWLNYDIAFIYHFRKQDTSSAALFFRQATEYASPEISTSHFPHTVLGEWYLDQYNLAAAKYNAQKNDPNIIQNEKDEMARKWHVFAELALYSYANSYALIKKRGKKYKMIEDIKIPLLQLYQLRRNNDISGLDAFAESVTSKLSNNHQ